ncbi:hypothetical protein [Streptomyces sp. NPDC058326]|uniref:hypothetical protein n=1 Tax=Streptomyces sp. NPDC058326 TaxID=3346447 RepID=UPI0036E891C4
MNTNTRTVSPRRRGTALAFAAAVCGVTLLTGCDDGSAGTAAPAGSASASGATTTAPAAPDASADKAFDPGKALASAAKKPYAANVMVTSETRGMPSLTMSGRANLNGLFTGRMEMKSLGRTTEVVTTADTNYFRSIELAGAQWTTTPRTDNSGLASYEGYAKLLLDAGPSARKGMEDQDGVATYHLSGRLSVAQIASVDPRTHASMKAKGVTGFDCDQWIDSQGRTLRFEQRFELRGVKAANKATFSDFGPAEKFDAPTSG